MGFLQNRIQRRGAEARRVFVRVGAVLFLFCMLAGVQNLKPEQKTKSTAADAAPKIVPITEEQHHHLVLDNDYVRVFHVEVAPHSETLYHQHNMDYVFVTLGDSKVASERVDGKSTTLELKDGETRFTKGGFAHKAVNLSDKPFVNVTVELKKRIGENFSDKGQLVNSGTVGDCMPADMGGSTACRNTYAYSVGVLDSAHWKVAMRSVENTGYTLTSAGLVVFVDDGQGKLNQGQNETHKAGEATWVSAGAKLSSEGKLRFVTMEYGSKAMPRDQQLSGSKK